MEISKSKFVEALMHAQENHDDIRLREDYSGRGMYGQTCIGVVGDTDALDEFELALSILTVADDLDDEVNGHTVLNALIDVRDMRRADSMGMDSIYYYPNLTVTA